MSFPASLLPARPRQYVATHHGLERHIVLANGCTLYVGTQATRDRNIQANNDPLYPVSFTGNKADDCALQDIALSVALTLNALPAPQRCDITGNPERLRPTSLTSYIEDGVIFAHQPVCDVALELYLVPVVTTGRFGPRVLPLHSCRNQWVVKAIR